MLKKPNRIDWDTSYECSGGGLQEALHSFTWEVPAVYD